MTQEQYNNLLDTCHKMEDIISKFKHDLNKANASIQIKADLKDISYDTHKLVMDLEDLDIKDTGC